MSLQMGIVGLPNVGKSTLFNALTAAGAAVANYPFCTIDPNVGVVEVPDERLHVLAEMVHPKKIVPATMEFLDIAGLVRGASKGEGLGNQFLGHIRSVNAIGMVVRCFSDTNVSHVEGSVDPRRDIETITVELCLADLQSVEKRADRSRKAAKSGDKKLLAEADALDALARASQSRASRAHFPANGRPRSRGSGDAPPDGKASALHRQPGRSRYGDAPRTEARQL